MQLDGLDTGLLASMTMGGVPPPESLGLSQAVARAFVLAVLLTGSAGRAEAAVMEAIRQVEPDEPIESTLFHGVLRSALQPAGGEAPLDIDELELAESLLPPGLRGVLRLSPQLRRCYTLRILMEIPRDGSARLLHMNGRRVDACACAAMRRLPALQGAPGFDLVV